ncbi:hypothetical protein L7F22_017778 [Adiantum nelumboides]|nr:hypothetical protein [Adiantum nelumboides]
MVKITQDHVSQTRRISPKTRETLSEKVWTGNKGLAPRFSAEQKVEWFKEEVFLMWETGHISAWCFTKGVQGKAEAQVESKNKKAKTSELEPTYMVTVGDIKCAYFDRVDKLKSFGQKNKETLADLVTSFFEYWAFRHDYTRTVISIRTGKLLTKAEKEWTRRIGNERHLICIEDPFEVSHDLGRVVDKHSIRVLREEFQRAARIMRQDANPCIALFEPYIRQKAQAA